MKLPLPQRPTRLRSPAGRTLLALLLLATGPAALAAAPPSDLEVIRQRVVAEFLAPPVDDGRIASLVATLRADGTWPGIDYQDVSRTGFQHRTHVTNLVEMSRAYAKPGSRWHRRPELKRAISSALDFWIPRDFIGENWHSNEIANPGGWTRVLLTMDEELSAAQAKALVRMAGRANLHAWGARPGGDLIKIAGIMAERALFERNEAALKAAVRAMAAEVRVTSGNGLKPDYSFNHRTDRVTSVLSYGTGYAAAFADWAVRLQGTEYQFPEKALRLVVDFFLEGIARTAVHGRTPDPGNINRDMSRRGTLTPLGPELPRRLLGVTDYRRAELERIAQIREGVRKPDLTGNRFFWHTEYMSHQRPAYFASVRMHSARNHNMESPHNSESLRMHHYADGASFISRRGDEYTDIFPVWDWQKIPGTTVVQKPALHDRSQIVKQGLTDFVGGVSDGSYGAAAFDFRSPHDPLAARKAWFFFDRELVALGAGIRSESEHPVATTLNQSLLRGPVAVRSGAGESVLARGEHPVKGAAWVHHDGIAYLFPEPTDVRLENRPRSGAWSDITEQVSARALPEAREEVFTLWLDHGRGPREGSYHYLVVPGIERGEIERYRRAGEVRVLANTPRLQGATHTGMDLTQLVFYQPGEIRIGEALTLSVDQPALVMLEGTRAPRRITVSDPTRKLASLRLRLSRRVEGAGQGWSAAWNEAGGYGELRIELPRGAYAGQSVVVDLQGGNVARTAPVPPAGVPSPAETRATAPGGGRFVGERFGGGVVFQVDEGGTSGLVAATTDQSAAAPWASGAAANAHVHANADGTGAGERNTALILDAHSTGGPTPSAARVCVEYRGGGFGDWYLPSKGELDGMYRERERIGGFANATYWSSSEFNVGFAWDQYFYGYGGQYTSTKGSSSRVRCVRRF